MSAPPHTCWHQLVMCKKNYRQFSLILIYWRKLSSDRYVRCFITCTYWSPVIYHCVVYVSIISDGTEQVWNICGCVSDHIVLLFWSMFNYWLHHLVMRLLCGWYYHDSEKIFIKLQKIFVYYPWPDFDCVCVMFT